MDSYIKYLREDFAEQILEFTECPLPLPEEELVGHIKDYIIQYEDQLLSYIAVKMFE